MTSFAIIQTDDEYEVIEVLSGQTPENAALAEGGRLVDCGQYRSYKEAHEALIAMKLADRNKSGQRTT